VRTIRREPGFDDAAKALLGTIQLADQALEGLEWALGREQEFSEGIYFLVGETTKFGPLIAFKTTPLGPKADVCLLIHFTYSANEIHLHRISSSTPADQEDDE
jgi:hypothetical protein